MKTFYFTYGLVGQAFEGGWTEVIAEDKEKAIEAFLLYHPSKNGYMPCCAVYEEKVFQKSIMWKQGNNLGAGCHEVISIKRELIKEVKNERRKS